MTESDQLAVLEAMVNGVIRALVQHPERVRITLLLEPRKVFEVSLAVEDLGRIVGKNGRTIRAIRELLHAASRNLSSNVTMDLLIPQPHA